MSEPTYKERELLASSMTLVVHPGEPTQRALWRVRQDMPTQQAHALRKARERHAQAPLAWVLPDGSQVPVAP